MITLWMDLDSLKAFARAAWNNPVVTEDEVPLVDEMSALVKTDA